MIRRLSPDQPDLRRERKKQRLNVSKKRNDDFKFLVFFFFFFFLFFLSVVYLTHVLPKVYYVFQKLNAENQQIEKSLNNYLYDRLKEQSRTNQNKMFIDVENSTYHSRKYNYTFLLCLNNSPGME